MRLAPPAGERALPVLAGVLLFLACPPATFLLPSFVGLVPLLVFIAEAPAGPHGRWSATRAGLVTGLVYFGLQLYWIAVALMDRSALAVPAYLLTVLVLAGLVGVFAWGVHFVREHVALPLALTAAILWTALEWTQAHLGDLAFPWLGLGTTLAPFPRVAGAADLVGARGLTFWLAAINGMVATLVLRLRAAPVRGPVSLRGGGGRQAVLLAATAMVVAVPVAYGFWRAETLELRPVARVAVIQPNITPELKRDDEVALDTSMAALAALTRSLGDGAGAGRGAGSLDLIAWPEVAVPGDLDQSTDVVEDIVALSRGSGSPILAGAYGGGARFNSAFLVEQDGVRHPRYDKRRLVPFVERVPFLDAAPLRGRLAGILGPATAGSGGHGTLVPGGRGAPLPAGNGARFGVLICYESAFAPLAREYRAAGAEFLVNITNDAWYGREPWYARTSGLWQHPAHLVLRAIETRVGIVRAANTGISMYVDPLGRTHQRTPLFHATARVGDVLTTDGTTFFVRWGDWPGTVSALAAIGLMAAGWLARRGRWTSERAAVRTPDPRLSTNG